VTFGVEKLWKSCGKAVEKLWKRKKLEVGSSKFEVKSWKLEVGSQKLEVKSQKLEVGISALLSIEPVH
jgi:hypothetical protein